MIARVGVERRWTAASSASERICAAPSASPTAPPAWRTASASSGMPPGSDQRASAPPLSSARVRAAQIGFASASDSVVAPSG